MVWYTIITACFRCPSSTGDLTDHSPKVCKSYLNARSYVTPHVQPYVDTYASPYVERARPYAEDFHRRVYTPSLSFGRESYEIYGAPRVDQIRMYGLDRWEKTLKPTIDAAQIHVKKQYDATLAPQVSKASTVASPYYMAGRENILRTYKTRLLPAYSASRPYIMTLYGFSHKIALETGLPYIQSAWSHMVIFVDRTIWPNVKVLYGENVEPQLVRIGERLGRYRDGRKLKAAVDEINR